MINGVTGVRVENTQVSFQRTIDGVEVSDTVRKVANEYLHKEQPIVKQRKNALIEYFKKLFGHNAPKETNIPKETNNNIKFGYGHVSF